MNFGIVQKKIIRDYILQIESLNKYIKELEATIRELKTRNAELTRRNVSLIEVEHMNERLFQEKKSLKNNIKDLENELIKTIHDKNNEHRINETKLENEIIYYKGVRETGLAKIDAADKIILLNDIQHNYILKIEQEVEDLKNENDIKMRQLKIEHEQNYKKLKKKMIDFIKQSEKDMEKSNANNIELYSKFSLLYKNQMLDELENQNNQILELLKQKEKQDKKIFALTEEIIIHDLVEKMLKKKNVEYQKFINNYIRKKTREEEPFKKEKEKEKIIINTNITTNNNDENEEKENKKKLSHISEEKSNKKILQLNTNNYNFENSIFKTVMNKKNYHDYISLEKEYKECLKNYQILKEHLNTLKDKEKLFQKKYYGIIKLYKIALEDLIQDEEITKKNIYINMDIINKGNYEEYTKEEKIKIVQLLIKHLLPLIRVQNNDMSDLRKTFSNLNFDIKNTTQFSKFSDNSRNLTRYSPFNNYRNITEDSNYGINKEKKFLPIFDNKINNKINNIVKNDESNSFKSSFWGINFTNNNIIKNKEDNSNFNKTNGFLYSANSFYNNKKIKKKAKEIKLNKRGIFGEEMQIKKSPLHRFMYIQNIKSDNKRNNSKNLFTDKNLSS